MWSINEVHFYCTIIFWISFFTIFPVYFFLKDSVIVCINIYARYDQSHIYILFLKMYNFYFFLVKLIVIFDIILIWSRRRRWLCPFCHLEETNQYQYYVQHISCQSVSGAMKLRTFLIFSKLSDIYIQTERKREYIFKCCSFVFALSIKMIHDFSPSENNISQDELNIEVELSSHFYDRQNWL